MAEIVKNAESTQANSTVEGICYAAIIGDVVGSRRIPERASLQRKLRSELEALNRRLHGALLSPLTLLRGDEIQGVFRQPDAVVELTTSLADTLFPIRLVHGMGYGPLDTDIVGKVTEMDGPCFHRARSALESAKKKDSWLVAQGFGDTPDAVISVFFQMMQAIRDRWTERQTQIVRRSRGALQKTVAEELDVSPSVVSESLKAASFATIREAEQVIGRYLKDFTKKAELR